MKNMLNNSLRVVTILLPAISLYWYGIVRDRNNIVGETALCAILDILVIIAVVVTLVSFANKKSRVQLICATISIMIIATSLFALGIIYEKDVHNLYPDNYIGEER